MKKHIERVELVELASKEFMEWKSKNKGCAYGKQREKINEIKSKHKIKGNVLEGIFYLDRVGTGSGNRGNVEERPQP